MTAKSGGEPAVPAPLSELPPAEFHNPLELKLDPYNPRLRQEEEGMEQTDLLKVMVDRFEIEELGESMVSSGFLAYDPMIGVREKGTVTILEGNRRLAALQLLLDPARAPNRRRTRWQQLSSQLTSGYLDRLRRIPVHVFESRDDRRIQAYVGFRHVTGVLPWPALEKAGYIARLIEQGGWSYSQVGERLGNRATTVERHYVAYRLVEQARELQIDGAGSMRNSFGVLIRAFQSPGIIRFLGISFPGIPKKSRQPVKETKLPNLKDFVNWTFGTPERAPIIRDSRQLTKWGRILESSPAISYLRRDSSPTFDRAWSKSGGESEALIDSLYSAADRLQESVPIVADHADEADVKTAVKECARYFVQILEHFQEVLNDVGIEIAPKKGPRQNKNLK